MVIGWLARELEGEPPASPWAGIEATQRAVQLPCLLVPQPAHAVLAGELAAALLPDAFGDFPAEILRAIQMHDTGWAASDAQQIQRLRSGPSIAAPPVSFIAISPQETTEAWTASIDSVEVLSKVGANIVSRHFTLLAQPNQPLHQKFKQVELARQRRLAPGTLATGKTASEEDLIRWTAALGFCDLVSLYLLSGLQHEVEFPLAHPAAPNAAQAPRVKLQIDGEYLHFAPQTVRAECLLTIHGLKHPVPAQGSRAETLTWEVE